MRFILLSGYNSIFDWIEKNGDVLVERKEFSNGGVGETFLPAPERVCKAGILAHEEMNLLRKTVERFSSVSTHYQPSRACME